MSYTPQIAALGAGLLALRLVVGLSMAAHGAQKLLGWFGGPGLTRTAEFFAALGFRPARPLAAVASVTEIASGLLMALGLLGPVGPALLISVMLVAMMSVHWSNGFFAQQQGIEINVLYVASALALALTGPGVYSLDALFGLLALWSPTVMLAVLTMGVIGGVANLALRSAPAQAH
jgi:putative oxidoreductase